MTDTQMPKPLVREVIDDLRDIGSFFQGEDYPHMAFTVVEAAKLLEQYDEALRLMVYQYCTIEQGDNEETLHNRCMVAGEHAFKVLGLKNGEPAEIVLLAGM